MTYRFLVVLWLLTLANIYDSKSSYNSPAYSLVVYGLVNTFYLIGLVRRKKGCNKVWCSPFKIKQKKKKDKRGAPAIGNNPHGEPPPMCFSCGTQSMEASVEPERKGGGDEVEAGCAAALHQLSPSGLIWTWQPTYHQLGNGEEDF